MADGNITKDILYDAVAPDEPVFRDVLARFYAGEPDPATLVLLR